MDAGRMPHHRRSAHVPGTAEGPDWGMTPPPAPDVLVIGAGVAGLTAARALRSAGRTTLVLEKSRGLGWRGAGYGRAAERGAHPRYAFPGGMSALGKRLAEGLEVTREARAVDRKSVV